MKKIMFNDKYGLTQAVLEGRKTQTRRIIKCPKEHKGEHVAGFHVRRNTATGILADWPIMFDEEECDIDGAYIQPRYHRNEIVAVAQNYKDAGVRLIPTEDDEFGCCAFSSDQSTGWYNKMFVAADLMPHQIKITDVRVERLQDITEDDCLKEGIRKAIIGYYVDGLMVRDWKKESHRETESGNIKLFPTPKLAYASLINKICGNGIWERNPWVEAYTFTTED